MQRIISILKVGPDLSDPATTIENVKKGVPFRGTHIWILMFATIVASVGLNVNSTAVIIGAMLISPLMGPIMGLGLGVGINDLELFRFSAKNFLFAILAALTASTLYFAVSPISEAHSELLARTTPAIWDVLIAFFGGLAAIIATASKEKWNVLPGAAIATALMPPLCTAGFGIANFQWEMVFGAMYLFVINAVFIGLATLLVIRALQFPILHFSDPKQETRVKRWIFIIVFVTGVPTLYVAYNVVRQNKFKADARSYIANETLVEENYLLNKVVDAPAKSITLTYGGRGLTTEQKEVLKKRLAKYSLTDAKLVISEGFSLRELAEEPEADQGYLTTIASQQTEIKRLMARLDSITALSAFQTQLIKEAKALHPQLHDVAFSRLYTVYGKEPSDSILLAYFRFARRIKQAEKDQINNWLKVKLNNEKVELVVDD